MDVTYSKSTLNLTLCPFLTIEKLLLSVKLCAPKVMKYLNNEGSHSLRRAQAALMWYTTVAKVKKHKSDPKKKPTQNHKRDPNL